MEWCKRDEEREMIMTAVSSLSDGMDHFFSLQLQLQQFLSLLTTHNCSVLTLRVNSNFLIVNGVFFKDCLSQLCTRYVTFSLILWDERHELENRRKRGRKELRFDSCLIGWNAADSDAAIPWQYHTHGHTFLSHSLPPRTE
jgi:hypothetical protein